MQPAATTSNGTTSFEVETDFAAADPRVARSSQPWAGGRNPFGIEDAYKVRQSEAAQSILDAFAHLFQRNLCNLVTMEFMGRQN